MARRKRSNPPLTRRSPWRDTASGMTTGRRGRGNRADQTTRRLRSMDVVLLDPQRLYDATLCSPDEFDYILYLYEEWLKRNDALHFFRNSDADGQSNPGIIHPRHALLMLLADKRANVPMEMLADLFGTDIDGISTYLSMTDTALTEVLAATAVRGVAGKPEETMPDMSVDDLLSLELEVPMAAPWDIIRPRTAKNYPGLLTSRRISYRAHPKDVDAAERRVEAARAFRVTLGVKERLKQYRRLTDPYTGYPGLDIEIAVISGLENLHLGWDQIRQENASLLQMLAKKRDSWC